MKLSRLLCVSVSLPTLLAVSAWAAPGGDDSGGAPPPVATAKPCAPVCQTRIPQDFVPMTRTERTAQYVKSLIGAKALVYSGLRAGIGEARGEPEEWPQDGRGFGYRLASGYAQHVVSTSFEDGIALGLDEDNRYFASGEQGFGRRLRYAVASSFLARHDDGSRHFSWSAIGGPASGAFISRLWQPDSTSSAADGAVSFGITEAIRVGMNVAREFSPRFVRRLLQ